MRRRNTFDRMNCEMSQIVDGIGHFGEVYFVKVCVSTVQHPNHITLELEPPQIEIIVWYLSSQFRELRQVV